MLEETDAPLPLTRALTLARIALDFGQVRRVTQHPDAEFESDTTHTVMLTLIAVEVAPLVGCDAGLTAQFAAVHDLPETFSGDTNTARQLTPEQAAEKARREAEATDRLRDLIDGSATMELLDRYEAQIEPEARLVRYLDKITPKLTHYLNGGSALRELGMTIADMRESHARQGAKLADEYPELGFVGRLFDAACGLVERGVAEGKVVLSSDGKARTRRDIAAEMREVATRLEFYDDMPIREAADLLRLAAARLAGRAGE